MTFRAPRLNSEISAFRVQSAERAVYQGPFTLQSRKAINHLFYGFHQIPCEKRTEGSTLVVKLKDGASQIKLHELRKEPSSTSASRFVMGLIASGSVMGLAYGFRDWIKTPHMDLPSTAAAVFAYAWCVARLPKDLSVWGFRYLAPFSITALSLNSNPKASWALYPLSLGLAAIAELGRWKERKMIEAQKVLTDITAEFRKNRRKRNCPAPASG